MNALVLRKSIKQWYDYITVSPFNVIRIHKLDNREWYLDDNDIKNTEPNDTSFIFTKEQIMKLYNDTSDLYDYDGVYIRQSSNKTTFDTKAKEGIELTN